MSAKEGWGAALVRFRGRMNDDEAVTRQEATIRVQCDHYSERYEEGGLLYNAEEALRAAGWLKVREVEVVAFIADGWVAEFFDPRADIPIRRRLP